MKCTSPISAYVVPDVGLVFHLMAKHSNPREVKVPCRQCLSCRLNRASDWQTRLIHESKSHDQSTFLTLTYDDDHLPEDGGLNVKHLQDFIKRLRKAVYPRKIRYYGVGEYGDTTRRAHYHAIIFGFYPSDPVLHSSSANGEPLYHSEFISKLWPFGFNLISPFSSNTAGYVARYVVKKQTGQAAKEIYRSVDVSTGELKPIKPPFSVMSLKPGIGFNHMNKFKDDYFRLGSTIIDGVRKPLPGAYVKRLAKENIEWHVDFIDRGSEFAYVHKADMTYQRLDDHDLVLKAKTSNLKRSI